MEQRFWPIIRFRKIWYVFSGVLFALSVVALMLWGLRFGIDFVGGSLLEVEYAAERPEVNAVREKLVQLDVGEVSAQYTGEKGIILRFRDVEEATHQEILLKLKEFGELAEKRFTSIGPVIGQELKEKALYALGAATLGIMAYVAWAFRRVSRPVPSWQYGFITAFVALFHDALIPLGAFAALGKFRGEEVGVPFIAAILTVIGFSVHDTIVVFDRTRENLKNAGRGVLFSDIVNKSLNQTLGRSLSTSFTVLLVTASIYLFGGATLKSFALVLLIGISAGTYSSLFIASPLLVDFQKLRVPRMRFPRLSRRHLLFWRRVS